MKDYQLNILPNVYNSVHGKIFTSGLVPSSFVCLLNLIFTMEGVGPGRVTFYYAMGMQSCDSLGYKHVVGCKIMSCAKMVAQGSWAGHRK